MKCSENAELAENMHQVLLPSLSTERVVKQFEVNFQLTNNLVLSLRKTATNFLLQNFYDRNSVLYLAEDLFHSETKKKSILEWKTLGGIPPNWTGLDWFRPDWSGLDPFRPDQTAFHRFRPDQTRLAWFRPGQTDLDQFRPV